MTGININQNNKEVEDKFILTKESLHYVAKERILYICLFLFSLLGNFLGSWFGGIQGFLLNILFGIPLAIVMCRVAKKVLQWSNARLNLLFFLIVVPLGSSIFILIVDRKIYNKILDLRISSGEISTRLSSSAVWSLLLFLFPYIGLPLSIYSLRAIRRSQGRLRGEALAWIALAINGLMMLGCIFVLVMGVLLSTGKLVINQ
jgi:hypothetical protein